MWEEGVYLLPIAWTQHTRRTKQLTYTRGGWSIAWHRSWSTSPSPCQTDNRYIFHLCNVWSCNIFSEFASYIVGTYIGTTCTIWLTHLGSNENLTREPNLDSKAFKKIVASFPLTLSAEAKREGGVGEVALKPDYPENTAQKGKII